ncbi:gamma-glutamyltranspeptidase-domain-containing protein [Phellopilus nigrolimitatus]|nr:gamma-glutamyltranspeptidase-domain-containing protein [Phellopilus nigrolimitatus]
MSRVTFADPYRVDADENAPLLQPCHTSSARIIDGENVGEAVRAFGIQGTSQKGSGILVVGRDISSLKIPLIDEREYVPLYQRRRVQYTPVRLTVFYTAVAALLLGFIVIATLLLDKVQHPTGPYPASPSAPPVNHETLRNPAVLIKAKNGAVATENEVCSKTGVAVLKDGGNAVDAAVAATFCIGVVNLFSSGIGGGGFMTIRVPPSSPNASSDVWSIDFRETAPAQANSTMYVDDPESSLFGGLSVGVPGEVLGLAEAHSRWGSLPWAQLVQPSVDLASGWKVGKELGRRLPWYTELIYRDPTWTAIFAPNGEVVKEGQLVRRTNYSRTLATIAANGADAFYKGDIADAIITAVQATGGIMTNKDLESYKVKVAPSLVGSYRGRKVYTPHAPTSGPVLLHMLNLLEGYDLAGEGRTGLNTHRLVEVIKFGFAARTKICDPSFTNDTFRIDEISTKSFGKLVSVNITDDTTHTAEYYNPVYDAIEDHGTSHVSVVDKNGMAAAITSTVNLVFGSQVMDPVTGILLNDEMDDFSTPGMPNAFGLWPSPYNFPEPNKRPLSSTVPTIIEHADGSFFLAIGGSGGSKIFPAVLQVILGIDEWGLDVSQAIEWGRVHDQLYPFYVEADNSLPVDSLVALRERGHNVTVLDNKRIAAVVQAVVKTGDTIYAASDSRKNGIAAGY